MTSIYTAIAEAVDLNRDTAERVIHEFLTRDANTFGPHTYSARMLTFRDATNEAFAAAGITADALVTEYAARAAYYGAHGAASIASLSAESIAAAIKQAVAA